MPNPSLHNLAEGVDKLPLAEDLRTVLGPKHVRTELGERMAYAYDATGEKHLPDVVAFPGSPEEVASCLRLARRYRTPVVVRGAGTNLSGGTVPIRGGLVLNLLRMDRILSIDPLRRRAVVEPGITNGRLNQHLRPLGLQFAPDPSSMAVCTIGGNIAENAGGPHCLKYGVTTGHVVALQVATAQGELVELTDDDLYDLRGLVIGSEGTLGVVTRATLRLTPVPAAARTLLAVYDDLYAAGRSVSGIIAAGIIPAALELMDHENLVLTRQAGYGAFPEQAEAALIIEVDGDPEDLDDEITAIEAICRQEGAVAVQAAETEAERAEIWRGRRANFGVLAQSSPFVWTQDVTVPRHRLPEMLQEVAEIGRRFGLKIATVAHAGDGNLHPTIPFNPRNTMERERVRKADHAVVAACLRLGGSITGEHGVGLDKLPGMVQMFSASQLVLMARVRRAFDPEGLLNPGKLLPSPKGGF